MFLGGRNGWHSMHVPNEELVSSSPQSSYCKLSGQKHDGILVGRMVLNRHAQPSQSGSHHQPGIHNDQLTIPILNSSEACFAAECLSCRNPTKIPVSDCWACHKWSTSMDCARASRLKSWHHSLSMNYEKGCGRRPNSTRGDFLRMPKKYVSTFHS